MLVEFKDVQTIRSTPQIKAYMASKTPVHLVVSPKTKTITSNIVERIRQQGGDVLIFDSKTNQFKQWK